MLNDDGADVEIGNESDDVMREQNEDRERYQKALQDFLRAQQIVNEVRKLGGDWKTIKGLQDLTANLRG